LGLILIINKPQNIENKERKNFFSITETNNGKGCILNDREAQRGGRGIDVPIFNLSTRRGGWLMSHPGCFALVRDLEPIYRRLSGPPG
jgi:hypothetical protein